MQTKYIFVTGGVVSGLGKGITAASLGRLLKNRGYKVANQKFDPYINVNPGKMSPFEHGEVFVTKDGAETDLDLGHYERFTDESLNKFSSVTTGKIYLEVLENERKGKYNGKTVQVIPHITNAIKDKVYKFDNSDVDIVITEIGGTVGDIEGLPFLEAIRQVGVERDDVVYIHVTLLPYIYGSNELKSKPTQHSVKELQSLGIKPDILVCRAEHEITESIKNKLALFCNVKRNCVIENKTVDNLYEVPIMLEEEGLADAVCKKLNLVNKPDNTEWKEMIENIKNLEDKNVNIAIVGKYVVLEDSYLSIIESLKHGGFANKCNVNIDLINCDDINIENVNEKLQKYSGIIIPSDIEGSGETGKLATIKYARENNIPFLGMGYAMELVLKEFIKNVAKDKENIEKTYINKKENMKLGEHKIKIKKYTLAYSIYNRENIEERYRNNYECKIHNEKELNSLGLIYSGINSDNNSVETIELVEHPYFMAVQYQPDLKSRPNKPHPIFTKFIEANIK